MRYNDCLYVPISGVFFIVTIATVSNLVYYSRLTTFKTLAKSVLYRRDEVGGEGIVEERRISLFNGTSKRYGVKLETAVRQLIAPVTMY